jgi:hypothetical protein
MVGNAALSPNAAGCLDVHTSHASEHQWFSPACAALKCLYMVVRSLDPKGTGQERWMTAGSRP